MAEMGPVLRDQRPSRRAGRHCPTQASCSQLYKDWREADSDETSATRSGTRCCEIHADQVFTIGTSPACCSRSWSTTRCATCRAKGIYSWDPGAISASTSPTTFWFGKSGRA